MITLISLLIIAFGLNINLILKQIKKKIILINNKNSIDFIDKDRVNLTFKKKQYGTYHIIKKVSNCFYLEKYD